MADEEKNQSNKLDAFRRDLADFWNAMPAKNAFFVLLAAWVLLFHFWGNSVLGYIKTPSLFSWLNYVYSGSPDDEHGQLIPFVVLALFWWKRRELMAVPKAVSWPALALVIGALLLHGLGYVVQVPQVSVVAFFVGLYGLTGVIWGSQWLRASFFPMILFAFCVPLSSLSDPITFPLRLFATAVTSWFSQTILGIDCIREGTQIIGHVSTGVLANSTEAAPLCQGYLASCSDATHRFTYEVAAACGGIRSLIAFIALTTLYAFVAFTTFWRRGIIIMSAIPLAVISNIFRLTSIMIATDAWGRAAGDFVHEKLAIVTYLPALACLLLLGYWLREPEPATDAPAGLATRESGSGAVRLQWSAVAAVVLLVGASAAYLNVVKGKQRLGNPGLKLAQVDVLNEKDQVVATNAVALPLRIANSVSQPLPVTEIELKMLPKDTTFGRRRYFTAPGAPWTDVSVVLMGADRTSIHKPEICLEGQGCRIEQAEPVTIPIFKPHRYDLPAMKLTATRQFKDQTLRAIYVYWFVSENRLTSQHRERVWWMAKDMISTGVLSRWAYVTYLTWCLPGQEDETFKRMQEFIAASVPEFQLVAGPQNVETAAADAPEAKTE